MRAVLDLVWMHWRNRTSSNAGDTAPATSIYLEQDHADNSHVGLPVHSRPSGGNPLENAEMSDFRERLLNEQFELKERAGKLNGFLGTPAFDGLPQIDREDLKEQLAHMRAYETVLDRRINRLVPA